MRKRLKRKFSWYVRWCLSLAVISASAGFLILSLPIWRLSRVEVRGVDHISKDKIINVAKVPVGENILLVDAKGIEKRLRSIVQVKNARVMKRIPDSLVIIVEEREPFALLVTQNRTYIIDDEGNVIASPSEASYYKVTDIGRFPVISGIRNEELINGRRVNFKDRIYILKTLKLMSRFLGSESLQVKVGNSNNIIVLVEDVLRLELGDSSQIERKIDVFRALLKEVDGRWEDVEYISVKVPDSPVIKFKNMQAKKRSS